MKAKFARMFIATLLSVLSSGCASIRARSDLLPRDQWTVYPGVQQGVKDISDAYNGRLPQPGWLESVLIPMFIVDLPVGAIFDTLALFYDLYRISGQEKSEAVARAP